MLEDHLAKIKTLTLQKNPKENRCYIESNPVRTTENKPQ